MAQLLVRWIHPAHIVFIGLLLISIIIPTVTVEFLSSLTGYFIHYADGIVLIIASLFILFCLYVALVRYGHIRLGADTDRPSFSRTSWLAMLFATGMGSGLVFYGAAEPLIHLMNPPMQDTPPANHIARAQHSMMITYFHWGFHAWAIYAVAGLCIAYFGFRHHRPFLPSAALNLAPRYATMIDMIAIIAIVFGLVGALSQGVLQLSDGANRLELSDITPELKLAILIAICAAFMLSSCSGISKGIKWLSNINMMLAITLMGFVFCVGASNYITGLVGQSIQNYLLQFPALSFNKHHLTNDTKWFQDWSVTLLLWWVAWAPFVGVFIARISRGRTIREFVIAVMLVPTLFSTIWFAVFGGTALHLELFGNSGFGMFAENPQQVTFQLLTQLPYDNITTLLALFLLFVFLVTSADSGAYVLSIFTQKGSATPPVSERLFWGIILTLVAAMTILTGYGTEFFKSIAIFGGIPYIFIMAWQCICLLKALRDEPKHAALASQ